MSIAARKRVDNVTLGLRRHLHVVMNVMLCWAGEVVEEMVGFDEAVFEEFQS